MGAGLGELTHTKKIASEVDDISNLGILKCPKLFGIFEIDIVQVFALARLTWYISATIDIEKTFIAI